MKVSFTNYDPGMPRTIYYELFAQAVRRNPRFVEDAAQADLCLPAEDVALETNWPRYGVQSSAFIRGGWNGGKYNEYLGQLVRQSRPLCIVNMHPFLRLPQALRDKTNIFVSDVSLAIWERLLNPRTISMPALPLAVGKSGMPRKSILASFRGVSSHPCRERLRQIHDGTDIICEIVPKANHCGQVDAIAGKVDLRYATLMEASDFAFVPRGDRLFSYRLLEAMSFGCIPVILSDGWILPFDRSVTWHAIGLQLPENEIHNIPRLLKAFPRDRIAEIQSSIILAYRTNFVDLDKIVESLLSEMEWLAFRERTTGAPRSASFASP